ncbi:hypothetical protein EK21DRAFT_88939 [Setomelanomma holmii]|uniref:Uncharacterized protein n=1 Tax=Setomelanomma holmii TaxID=210430 RepID=A0A9P4HB15_9PLEO|nr:hypothetical protein EK21DRAFT_88939 [Setomelanomma holmii]
MHLHNTQTHDTQILYFPLSAQRIRPRYKLAINQGITSQSASPALPTHSANLSKAQEPMEEIELKGAPFPPYLPLRPDKHSFWRKPLVLIITSILLYALLITGTFLGSMSLGREMQRAKYRKLSGQSIAPSTSTITMKITHTKLVANYTEYIDMRLQSTLTVTKTDLMRPETSQTMLPPASPTGPHSSHNSIAITNFFGTDFCIPSASAYSISLARQMLHRRALAVRD